uniref:BRCT domain-containing protein n=1 Tax=Opuntia streptacantha TaxID=393608 RepID=A0A7C9ARN1_OPUST
MLSGGLGLSGMAGRGERLEQTSSATFSYGDGGAPCDHGLFSGLVICVTGLSKEARRQVKEATERFGGTYSPSLHPNCTHLVVQGFGGRKLEHAFKYGSRNGLSVVNLRWFVESLRKNMRLGETPYVVHEYGEVGSLNSCVPLGLKQTSNPSGEIEGKRRKSYLSGHSIYIDSDISSDLKRKVVEVATSEGAVVVNQWFVGSGAAYVVCEGSSIQRYLGHSDNIVSPLWVLKKSKDRSMHRFARLSTDLARQVGLTLENLRHESHREKHRKQNSLAYIRNRTSKEERLQIVSLAKHDVRSRRARRLQSCGVPLRPISPSSLLDSICWSVSEPTSTAAIRADPLLSINDSEIHKHILHDGCERVESEVSNSGFLRPLAESEKNELVFKNNFLTVLFPVDRFAEMGPSSRTYFSETGFTCLQLLDHIYEFYQENMSDFEIEAAIHTDSRHAEQLRSVYCSERSEEFGSLVYKRVDFLGSRISFEMLKRVSGDNNSNVYELVITA